MNQTLQLADVMAEALATGLFVSSCTITALPSPLTVGASGSPNAAYVAVGALTGIRCMMAVISPGRSPDIAERKTVAEQMTSNDWHCLLEAYYPTIETNMRAVINGETWDIVNVDHDSQIEMTRLRIRQVSM